MSIAVSEKKTLKAANRKKVKNSIDKIFEHGKQNSRTIVKTLADKGCTRSYRPDKNEQNKRPDI